jgi:hypothetical protein
MRKVLLIQVSLLLAGCLGCGISANRAGCELLAADAYQRDAAECDDVCLNAPEPRVCWAECEHPVADVYLAAVKECR